MTITRRDMLKKTAGTAAIVGAAMAGGHALLNLKPRTYPVIPGLYSDKGVRLIRPPGALDETRFLAGCIRCYMCQDACDPGAIQFFTEAEGKHYHTPYVDPSVKGCTLCMKCTQVCPTGVLELMQMEDKADADMATVELREDMCLSFKAKRIRDEQSMSPPEVLTLNDSEPSGGERRGPCGECFMYCPLRGKAIELEPGAFLAPVVFEDHCVGCGMCEEICRVMVHGEPAIRVIPKRGHVA